MKIDRILSCVPAWLADLLSLFRLGVAIAILWMGLVIGPLAFPAATLLATLGWISDGIDGPLARRSSCRTHLARLDYPIDVTLTWAEFIFAAAVGFIPVTWVAMYSAIALGVTLWFRRKAVLVLFMRGIDLVVVAIVLHYAPLYLLPIVLWGLFLGLWHRQRVQRDVTRWFSELATLFHLKHS